MFTLKLEMIHLITRQEDRSIRYTRVVDEDPRPDSCVWNMRGKELSVMNSGRRLQKSALRQCVSSSSRSFSLSMGGDEAWTKD